MMISQATTLYLVPPKGGVYLVVGWDSNTTQPYAIPIGGKAGSRPILATRDYTVVEYFIDINAAQIHAEWCSNRNRELDALKFKGDADGWITSKTKATTS